MATTTTTNSVSYTPSFVKYSDLVHAGLIELFHKYGVRDRNWNWRNALESGLYRMSGRAFNNQITTPIPMVFVNEDDMFAGIVAGFDSAIRKNQKASKAALEGLYQALASYLAVYVHTTLKIPDAYIV